MWRYYSILKLLTIIKTAVLSFSKNSVANVINPLLHNVEKWPNIL